MRRTFGIRRSILTTLLVVPTAVGCMTQNDRAPDTRIAQSETLRVWSISGQRRVTSMFFPWNKRWDQDRFRAVRSDGKRWIAAMGAQPSENQPHSSYLYVIDALKGKVTYVIPSIASNIYAISDEFVVLVGNLDKEKQPFEIRLTADGSLVRKGLVSDYLRDEAYSVAIVGDVVRLIDPDGRREVFFSARSGEAVTREDLGNRAKAFAGLSLPVGGSWSVAKIMEDRFPEQTRCDGLVISINSGSRTTIVASREETTSRPAPGKR